MHISIQNSIKLWSKLYKIYHDFNFVDFTMYDNQNIVVRETVHFTRT